MKFSKHNLHLIECFKKLASLACISENFAFTFANHFLEKEMNLNSINIAARPTSIIVVVNIIVIPDLPGDGGYRC